jgi:methyl-accepting chemotaxis protein
LSEYASGLDQKGKPGEVQELKTPSGAPMGVAWTNLGQGPHTEVLNPGHLKVGVFSDKTATMERLGNIAAVMIIAGALVCAAMCGLGYLFVRPMVRPIQSVAAIADNISRDDYSNIDIDSKRPDEIGVMTRAFKLMVENLRNQRKSTLEGVSVLATSASEITATASQLSASTTRTSSAVSETTATAEEVKQAAMVSSAKAKDVAEKAKEADRTATSGINAAEDMSRRMGLIRDQMTSINNAISGLMEHRETILNTTAVVANIAEQSNLLAVNAAIESVRSGEHGHGFGVVAQDIKALADQSKQAANKVNLILRDAGALISAAETASNQTNEAIDAGVRQADTVRDVIRSLSNSVSMAARDAEVIEASGEQQFVGIDQLAQAMASIDHAMSQSMSGAQQLESEAAKLEELGERLRELVEFHR